MLIPLSVSEQTTTTPAAPKKKGSCEQYPIKRQENEATKTRSFAMYGPKLTIVCRTLLLMCSNLFWSLCLLILLYYFVYSIRNNRFNSYISLSLLKMKIKKYIIIFFFFYPAASRIGIYIGAENRVWEHGHPLLHDCWSSAHTVEDIRIHYFIVIFSFSLLTRLE